ncbi:MAG: sigma-70 family RNA polymerase sigma factor [Clostridiales Family XIII bacterium]|jgi:RNA polymerase sigma-70 factor (ECF subfamily)|nr:sigma-70 family RNA polymerase sigma factor [Clostridiales Family XIII bacterium]
MQRKSEHKSEIVALARKAKRGDRAAFEELCRRKQRSILFTAYTMLGSNADAEDAAQETIITMYRSINELKSPEAVSAWIETIVRSRCIEILRRRTKYEGDEDIDDESIVLVEENREFLPEAYAEDEAMSDRLYEIILGLPEKRRETILQYYYEDLSYKEIAEITGTSVKTVSTNLMKARKMIKDKLNMSVAATASSSTSTVMGRMLKDQAAKRITDAQMASVESKWTAQIKMITYPAAVVGSAVALKIAVAVVATVAAFSGIVYSVVQYDRMHDDAPTATVTAGAQSGRTIIFAGNDCDCGHINPVAVTINGLEDGDTSLSWELKTEDGIAFASGSGAEISQAIRALSENDQDGKYIVLCSLYDKDGNFISMTRSITIGNFKGDAI